MKGPPFNRLFNFVAHWLWLQENCCALAGPSENSQNEWFLFAWGGCVNQTGKQQRTWVENVKDGKLRICGKTQGLQMSSLDPTVNPPSVFERDEKDWKTALHWRKTRQKCKRQRTEHRKKRGTKEGKEMWPLVIQENRNNNTSGYHIQSSLLFIIENSFSNTPLGPEETWKLDKQAFCQLNQQNIVIVQACSL